MEFFNHDKTNFPRTGAHKAVECNQCHITGSWQDIAYASCDDCHSEKNPHDTVEVAREQCDSCHTTQEFTIVNFAHLRETTFDLAPQHVNNSCVQCHEQLDSFSGLQTECTACHNNDKPWGHYEGQCVSCHQSNHWSPGGLGDNDHKITGFKLKGAHKLLPCESCHADGKPRGAAAPTCDSCHKQDDPHRNQLGMMCNDCHFESNWFDTRFRHITTGWPLRGSHQLAECVDCHALGYIGTPNTCDRCHESQAIPNRPEHSSALFRDCETCHNEYAWFSARP